MRRRWFVFGLMLALGTSCTKVYNPAPSPTPVPATTPTPPAPVANVIEFRVFGQVGNVPVIVKMTNSVDGVSILTAASLPYVASIKSLQTSIFLDLEATAVPAVVPGSSLQVQIFVDGVLFREAFATGITPLVADASGTYRR